MLCPVWGQLLRLVGAVIPHGGRKVKFHRVRPCRTRFGILKILIYHGGTGNTEKGEEKEAIFNRFQ